MLRNDIFSLPGTAQDVKPQELAAAIVSAYQQRGAAPETTGQQRVPITVTGNHFLLSLNRTLEVRSGGSAQRQPFHAVDRLARAIFVTRDHRNAHLSSPDSQAELARRWINLRVLFQLEDKIHDAAAQPTHKPGTLPPHVVSKEDQALLYLVALTQMADVNWLERVRMAPTINWAKIREVGRLTDPAQRQDLQPNDDWGRLGATLEDATKLHRIGLSSDYTTQMLAPSLRDFPHDQHPVERLKHLIAQTGDGFATPAGKFFSSSADSIRKELEIKAVGTTAFARIPELMPPLVVVPPGSAIMESNRPTTAAPPSADGAAPIVH